METPKENRKFEKGTLFNDVDATCSEVVAGEIVEQLDTIFQRDEVINIAAWIAYLATQD
ncbi:hypothetical protein LCGC14_0619450 [marine sediment metagenome]|uniref:Uncharacterized protein n=1 Tax=marine sediment metagenome TaxID=412755 RepID=A0A0F9UDV0_9ZZZZ